MRIALLSSKLEYGGAERQIVILANALAKTGHSVNLFVFYPGGRLRDLVSPEVDLHCLDSRGRWDIIRPFRRFLSLLSDRDVEILYAFLPGPNLMASLTKLWLPFVRVVWGVRASDMDLQCYPLLTRLAYALERRLSKHADLIISNSVAGRSHAAAQGFPDSERLVVVPNGIDAERFYPDRDLGNATRRAWGVKPEESLVGIVARLDPMKDHCTFLEAAAQLAKADECLRFVSAGTGPAGYAAELREYACNLGLRDRMIWAGACDNPRAAYNALDVLVSSSAFGEGFSNVLAEAMACGIPCVATDVGDAREILGPYGLVVAKRNPEALANGISQVLSWTHRDGDLRHQLRQHIIENYSVDNLVRQTCAALEPLLKMGQSRGAVNCHSPS